MFWTKDQKKQMQIIMDEQKQVLAAIRARQKKVLGEKEKKQTRGAIKSVWDKIWKL